MKAASLFGGAQVFNIIIAIIRSKFIAILLGPTGIGIATLFTTTIGLISGLTNFGLGTSAVRDISAANATGNQLRISTIVKVFRRLVWITGILGTLVAIICSSWLSQLTFGNTDYTIAFIWISITLLFKQISAGQLAVLQGMRKLQYLAKANVIGSALGLIFTVPLYYKLGIKGIVPAIIMAALISLLLSWYFAFKIKTEPIKVSSVRTFAEGKSMLLMGFMISLSSLITLGASYVVRIFINNTGGVEQVGLYSAGFAIINTYVGLIFTAMGADYFPRLSAVAHSNKLSKEFINQQAEMIILVLAPIIMIFLIFIQWIVITLYSDKFIAIDEMIHWAAMGMFFKASSWSIGFILLAKGASKIFFWSEVLANTYLLILNLIGYNYFGLEGLGISFFIGYVIHLFQIYLTAKISYQYAFDTIFFRIFIIQFLLAASCFIVMRFIDKPYSYYIGIILIFISGWYSYRELSNRIGLKELVTQRFKKPK